MNLLRNFPKLPPARKRNFLPRLLPSDARLACHTPSIYMSLVAAMQTGHGMRHTFCFEPPRSDWLPRRVTWTRRWPGAVQTAPPGFPSVAFHGLSVAVQGTRRVLARYSQGTRRVLAGVGFSSNLAHPLCRGYYRGTPSVLGSSAGGTIGYSESTRQQRRGYYRVLQLREARDLPKGRVCLPVPL
jgi:hypothetical protein